MNELTRKPLRLWPGVAFAIVQSLMWFVLPVVAPDAGLVGMIGGAVGAVAIFVWWIFFSRAPWSERVGAIVLMVVAVLITKRLVHESIAGAGMGMLMYVSTVPGLCLALVAWAVVTRRLASGARRVLLVVAIMLACAPWTLIRTAGVTSAGSELHLRWTPTPEQRLLAQGNEELKPLPPPPATTPAATPNVVAGVPARGAAPDVGAGAQPRGTAGLKPGGSENPVTTKDAEWPGFRGPDRDGVVHGVRINTDWSASPPVQMWRRPIGPGWSSFAVSGDLLYTQEQRGDDEIVACYKVSTGEPVWRHRDATRFWESNGGPGPRGTPTLHHGRVYTFGATGIVNALDAASGAVVWSRNSAADTDVPIPMWGFASSPLVSGDAVVVAAAGTLAAYDLGTGKPRWIGPHHTGGYSSPQLATIDGVAQILLLSAPGVISVSPADGALLWEHTWEGSAITQPAMTTDGDVLINAISMTGGIGVRRLSVTRGTGGWKVEERWTSTGLKPYFNDFVVHKGFGFGFDGSILTCIDLADGKRKWKGGRYGNGQLVLLADQDLMIVISEEGELALVKAIADQFTELARFPAIDGKTWNHPVLVGDVLLVRNGEEMAAFRMSLQGR